MKKLLTILGTTGLVVSTSTVLVSCSTNENTESLIKDITLTLGTNDSNDKQTKVQIDKLNESKVLLSLRFKDNDFITDEPLTIKNEIVSAELITSESIILIEALKGGTTTIEVVSSPIVEDENSNSIFTRKTSEEVIETINVKVIDETPENLEEENVVDPEDQTTMEPEDSSENEGEESETEVEFGDGESTVSDDQNDNQNNEDYEETFD